MESMEKTANKVSLITILGNVLLTAFKLLAGIVAHSGAMLSDAVHSASDIFSTVVVMIGIRFAAKEADSEHPYGHERLECIAAILLAAVLFATGLGIGMNALGSLTAHGGQVQIPGMLALVAAVVSIVTKEAMYHYTKHYAKKLDSGALMADAWHHRSDAFSSVGALIGIGGARLGFPAMDSIASLVIFFFIAKAAFDIFMDAINKMVDRACDEETQNRLIACALESGQVLGIDLLKTRIFGNRSFVEMELRMNADFSLQDAHAIAQEVHDRIEQRFPKVKHITIHVNPAPPAGE